MIRLLALGLASTSALHISCTGSSDVRFEYRQRHMGTEARIVFHATDSTVARAAAAAAFVRIAEIDRRLSDYRVDSEVSRIAGAAAGEAVPVSGDLIFVLSRALSMAKATDGAFDPTAGSIVALWREATRTGKLPDSAEIPEALARTGWRNVVVDTAARTVRSTVAGLRLDFGGIAKGWAADEAIAMLRRHGVMRALVEFGGDIVAAGPPPGEPGWRVLVDATGDTVLLADGAISTSGEAEQSIEIEGVRHSHVVDPRTGKGLTHGRSATVRAPVGWLADVLATAATVVDSTGLERLRRLWPGARITIH